MKKIFQITGTKKAPERQVDAIKHEVKKYIARERRKELPEGKDYWDFDCKIGGDASSAKKIHLSKISESIDELASAGKESFYLEVLAKTASRKSKD